METRKKILIVDDVLDNIEVLGGILRQDYDVIMALNGAKAVKMANMAVPPDLILLDIMMPDMDGYDVCRQLKENPATSKIPVIFVSAKGEEVDEVTGFALGAVDYITKPVTPSIVRARVKTHLTLTDAIRELEKQNSILQENIRLREDIERISKHDLKGPMTIFLNAPEMLLASDNQTPDQVELLHIMIKSAHRLMEMIHHSLDLYKMEKGTYTLTPTRIDLVKIINDVLRDQAALAAAKKIDCVLLLNGKPLQPQDAFPVVGEELLFFSMLSNLIKNSLEASPVEQKVTISLNSSQQPAVAINNQGMIPAQIRERFFERYATFGKERGTGLGVYSARLMAKTMGGDLSFTSDEVGGTTLLVTTSPATV